MKNSLIKIALLFSFQFIHLHAKHVDESIKIIPLKYYYDIFNGYSNDYGSSHVYDDISGCYSGYSYSQYQPDKKDCNRFFVCNPQYRKRVHDQPMALVGVCPPEMWFDANHSDEDRVVCTHFKIICASEYTDMYDYCDCKAINHAMDKVGAQQANTEAEEFSNEESITCIVDNEFHLFESVKDCEKYYVCFNTKVFPMQCKPGLHFNPITKYCDSPEVTGCKVHFGISNIILY